MASRSLALRAEYLAPPITAVVASVVIAVMLEYSYGEGDFRNLCLFIAVTLWLGGLVVRSRLKEVVAKEASSVPAATPAPSTPGDAVKSKLRYTPLAASSLNPGTPGASTPDVRKLATGPASATVFKATPMTPAGSRTAPPGSEAKTSGAVGSIKRTVMFGAATPQSALDESVYNSPEIMVRQQSRTTAGGGKGTGSRSDGAAFLEPSAGQQETVPQQQQIVKRAQNPLLEVDEEAARAQVKVLVSDARNSDLAEVWVTNLRGALHELLAEMLSRELETVKGDMETYIVRMPGMLRGSGLAEADSGASAGEAKRDSSWWGFSDEAQARARQPGSFARFLTVRRTKASTPFPAAYVLRRIRTLTEGRNLAAFDWNGGERFEGRDWSADRLPTDAEIIFNAFCCWVDSSVKREKSFGDVYVRDVDELLSAETLKAQDWFGFLNCGRPVAESELHSAGTLMPMQFQFEQTPAMFQRSFKPHWKVVFRGEVLEVRERRLNVFHAILIFLAKLNTPSAAVINNRPETILRKVFGKGGDASTAGLSGTLLGGGEDRYTSHGLFF